jgi:hypothetical protein
VALVAIALVATVLPAADAVTGLQRPRRVYGDAYALTRVECTDIAPQVTSDPADTGRGSEVNSR